ncbi:MAG: hypothetical protein ABI587_10785 [Gemmatimonadales bacterium]
MLTRLRPVGAFTGIALTFMLAGCSDSNSPSANGNLMTTVEAQSLADDVADDVTGLADASAYDASTGLSLSAASVGGVSVNTPPPACVAITPTVPTSTDGDIVPDSVRFDYSQCVFTRANGNIIDSLSGTIDFLDAQPTVPSLGVRHVFTDFARNRTNVPFPARSFSAVDNGTREWGASADTLGHTITNFVTVRTHPVGRSTTHTRNWTGHFTADLAGTILLGFPLPAGDWTVDGTGTWSRGNRAWSVVTSTVTAMHYNPACTVEPKLDAGELALTVTRNGEVTNIDVLFTACGAFTVTRTAATV